MYESNKEALLALIPMIFLAALVFLALSVGSFALFALFGVTHWALVLIRFVYFPAFVVFAGGNVLLTLIVLYVL